MRITVDIEPDKLAAVLQVTGKKKKSPAVVQAIDEYLAMKARASFASLIREKQVGYALTNDALEAEDREGFEANDGSD